MKSVFDEGICQLCLQVDIKVYRISDVQHVFIESILKLNDIHYVPSENLSVCPICMVLLVKTYNFVQTVWKAQEIVYDMLQNIDMITKSTLQSLDRHKIGLNPMNLTSQNIILEIGNLDNNNTIDIDPEENNSLTQETRKTEDISEREEEVEISYDEEELVDLHESNKVIFDISREDHSDITNKPRLSEIKPNSHKLDLGAIECHSLNKFNEAPVNAHHKDKSDFTKDPFLSVIEPNPVVPHVGTVECVILNECNEAPIVIKQEEDCNNTKDPLLSVIKSNPVQLDIGAIECDTKQTKPAKQKKKKVIKKEKDIVLEFDSETPSEDEKKRLEEDGDYMPALDSTSHSEDSAYDDYDDEGKKIKKPKHGLVYPRKCDNCNYEVPQHNVHYHHYLFMHPNIPYPYAEKKEYACSVCGKLMTNAKIKAHERNHIAQNLQCPQCPKKFRNHLRLYYHQKTVHTKNILICDYCSKGFKTRIDLLRHLRTHTGTKPYKCHICDATFAHSGNRTIHIRSAHQNIKYVPKKQMKKPRKAQSKNKHNLYEGDMSSDEEKPKKRKIKRKKSTNPDSKSRKKTNMAEGNKKSKLKKKKTSDDAKENCENNITLLHAIPENKDIDSESEDEVLSEIKRRKTSNE